jgi:hypothetical protein
VTLVFLGADCDITPMHLSFRSGQTNKKFPGSVVSKVMGQEGVLVLAFPMDKNKEEPRFDFLEQFPLKEVAKERGKNVPEPEKDPKTQFRSLMKTARVGQGTRSWVADAPNNPVVLSWTVVP